ncbi:hypothetical protein [Neptuniibacter sp. QD37_11]|uniref:hypothetical protein n=1 Tax=Neptuniibacter sp. QD37_11 TaxID=3398209 RepID=UPI0039F5AEC9
MNVLEYRKKKVSQKVKTFFKDNLEVFDLLPEGADGFTFGGCRLAAESLNEVLQGAGIKASLCGVVRSENSQIEHVAIQAQLPSGHNIIIDGDGVHSRDAYLQSWYDEYWSSTHKSIETIDLRSVSQQEIEATELSLEPQASDRLKEMIGSEILPSLKLLLAPQKILEWPLQAVKTSYHIGTLDIEDRKGYSFEGDGLSISPCPETWQRIAKGALHGSLHKLTHQDTPAKFLDFWAVVNSDAHVDAIECWALESGLFEVKEKYCFSYYDDEMLQDMRYVYDTYEEAFKEADEQEELVSAVIEIEPSSQFKSELGREGDLCSITQAALTYAKDKLGLDGVWWDSTYDPLRYSAPAGVIFQDKIENWDKQKLPSEYLSKVESKFLERLQQEHPELGF